MESRKHACVIIIDNDKVLLMHRIKNGREYYAVLGGGVEDGETLEQAAMREVKEEANLDVVLGDVFCIIIDERRDGTYYLTKKFSGEMKLGGPEAEINNDNNHYDLQRIKKEEIGNIPLLPSEIKDKIIEYFARK